MATLSWGEVRIYDWGAAIGVGGVRVVGCRVRGNFFGLEEVCTIAPDGICGILP